MFDGTGIRLDRIYDYTHDGNYSFSGHRHHGFEINIVLEGTLRVVYESFVIILQKNDIFIGEPYAFHRNKCESDMVRYIVFQFDTEDIPITGNPSIFRLSDANLRLLGIILEETGVAGIKNSDMINRNAEFPDTVKHLFEVFLFRILRDNTELRLSGSRNSSIYSSAVNFMRENIGQSLSGEEIAKHCGICRTTLKSVFRECAGLGVNRFFTEMKIGRAKQYLRKGMSAASVSEALGFSSQAYFSRVFKEVTGITPVEFRRS